MSPKRAKITRSGKQFYLPGRTSEGELARDQELLNAIGKNVSVEEAEKAVAQIRQQREEELKRSADEKTDVKGGKRARIKRGGKDYYMPVRGTDGERARDQELLNSIGMNMSEEETKEAVRKIRRQRESEVGLGGVAGSSHYDYGAQWSAPAASWIPSHEGQPAASWCPSYGGQQPVQPMPGWYPQHPPPVVGPSHAYPWRESEGHVQYHAPQYVAPPPVPPWCAPCGYSGLQ